MTSLQPRLVGSVRHASLGLLILMRLAVAVAATPEAVQRNAERAAIVKERNEASARFAAQQRICQSQFVVTACMNKAVEARRIALTRLHDRELAINDAQRRETAALRQAAIAAKAASAAEPRGSEPGAAPRHEAPRKPSAPNPPAIKPPRAAASGAQPASSVAEQRRLTEQRNEAAFAAKAREVEAHREAVQRRNAERAASGKAAAPLPSPASAP